MKKTFTITEEHLKLLAHANVHWCPIEAGAPDVHPEKPYGSYALMKDINFILAGSDEEPNEQLFHRYRQLHRETEFAMSILLQQQGKVVTGGTYERDHPSLDWKLVRHPGEEGATRHTVFNQLIRFEHHKDFTGDVLIFTLNRAGDGHDCERVPFSAFLGVVAAGLRHMSIEQLKTATDLQILTHETALTEERAPHWVWYAKPTERDSTRAEVLPGPDGHGVILFRLLNEPRAISVPLAAARFLVRCYLDSRK